MDARPDALAESVRARRIAIDHDLERLRVRLKKADPRQIDTARLARKAAPVAAGAAAVWLWARRGRHVRSLKQLLVRVLSDLHRAEQRLVPALETMSGRASNADLRRAFDQHRHETEGQIDRLARVFRSVGARPARGSPATIAALIRESDRLVRATVHPDVRDAALIAGAQRVEHVEIAAYGTARAYADTLGYTHAAQLLQQTLDEERAADDRLTRLAERFVNRESIR